MSIFQREMVTCPQCGDVRERDVAHSINAERSPQFREAVLDGTFQRVTCIECQTLFELGHPFLYIDFPRRQWFSVQPVSHQLQWRALEREAADTFARCHGPDAPTLAQQLANGAVVRLVFGVDALREKLVCGDAGFDDVLIEVIKFEQLGFAPNGELLDETTHARLVDAGPEELTLLIGRRGASEATLVEIARSAYDDITHDASWAEMIATLSAGPFVDIGRLTIRARSKPGSANWTNG